MSTSGGATADGTALVQKSYNSASSQIWTVTSLADGGFYKINSTASSSMTVNVPTPVMYTSGGALNIAAWSGADTQKWTVTVAD